MTALKTGFARLDITPPLGTTMAGYFHTRYADGILDPLMATAVVFDDGEKRAAVLSVDIIGFNQQMMADVRPRIAAAVGTEPEGVYVACTHTHLGPCTADSSGKVENEDYIEFLTKKLCDAAVLAAADLAPTEMLYTRGKVEDVAFVRRFRMKDGSVRTNPGWQNPDIDHAIGTPDENSSLLILRRENKPEIGIVHFQVHPDVISGTKFSADFPKFVRDTYETLIPGSRCMYLNGTQGDTNHIDVRLSPDQCRGGYARSRYMGRRIAMSVLENYELAKPLSGTAVRYGQKSVSVRYNKGRPDQIEEAIRIHNICKDAGESALKTDLPGMERTTLVAESARIVSLMSLPDEKELILTAVAVGDAVFAGLPGEPFTDVGRGIKNGAHFTLAMPTCCSGGYEGYYPMQSAYDEGGYEARTARYAAGTAEKLIEESLQLVNGL